MKTIVRNYLLLAGVAGIFGFATQLGAASYALPACGMGSSCCGGVVTKTISDTKAKPYPLETCIVSGEKLGEMGKPFVFVYKDQEVKLCCKNCKKDFDKDPEKYMKIIRAADKK